mmetsp:Transcript_28397/g.36875  ORF Transcript_28397/g.36875 Transcript_28397/m.36875 type:complete len:366 (+) Transcript_28397:60-1157(+)|eukprot:CAMPEP_0117808306 /NCGR_PEP_ID=MMETSP0948-20121206/19922_1 /TAXON_ID=44440 /ORGANISM="Chattonella subsalsa, Strain CCMP2191" /LENGTH=365 /DNA_ID=CAMNT_0005643621 /DNA_START=51 /DNA_END=1148 /DNA_ORIENTATION=+
MDGMTKTNMHQEIAVLRQELDESKRLEAGLLQTIHSLMQAHYHEMSEAKLEPPDERRLQNDARNVNNMETNTTLFQKNSRQTELPGISVDKIHDQNSPLHKSDGKLKKNDSLVFLDFNPLGFMEYAQQDMTELKRSVHDCCKHASQKAEVKQNSEEKVKRSGDIKNPCKENLDPNTRSTTEQIEGYCSVALPEISPSSRNNAKGYRRKTIHKIFEEWDPLLFMKHCQQGNISEVQSALESAPSDTVRQSLLGSNSRNFTPFHSAAANGHLEVVRCLYEHHAVVNAVDEFGWTPLMYACYCGRLEVAQALLLEMQADIAFKTTKECGNINKGSTALTIADTHGFITISKLILQVTQVRSKKPVKFA